MAVDRSKPKQQKAKQRAVTGGIISVKPVSSTTRGSPPKNPQQNSHSRQISKPPLQPQQQQMHKNFIQSDPTASDRSAKPTTNYTY
jgi:hypothetical protein